LSGHILRESSSIEASLDGGRVTKDTSASADSYWYSEVCALLGCSRAGEQSEGEEGECHINVEEMKEAQEM